MSSVKTKEKRAGRGGRKSGERGGGRGGEEEKRERGLIPWESKTILYDPFVCSSGTDIHIPALIVTLQWERRDRDGEWRI